MNDADVIKALLCCTIDEPCRSCPMHGWACKKDLMKLAYDLVKRQKAEIERLQGYNENLLTANTALSNEILDIKTEAIKEFAERLKKKVDGWYYDFANFDDTMDALNDIDNLVKEMTEGEKWEGQ